MPSGPPKAIVLVITDQQRFDTIAALGYDHVDTPNLDRLVREGTAFTHNFVTAPSCGPARASLFCGKYPRRTGTLENMDPWPETWVGRLAEQGYHCVNVGKMHTSPWEDPFGFHERFPVENKDRYRIDRWYVDEWDKALRVRGLTKPSRASYAQLPDWHERLGAYEWPLPEEMHPDVFVGQFANWWLDYQPRQERLFLQVGFPGPHPPYDPIERYTQPYKDRDLKILPFDPEELDSQPAVYRATREKMLANDPDAVCHLPDPTFDQRQRQRAYYLANVTMIDEQIGELLEALQRNGYLDDCMVIFSSDHGDCLGDHGHSQKFNFYEAVVRTPCIFWSPGRIPAGRTIDELVQWMDIGPTILELAGADVPEDFDAVSLLPLLEDRPGAAGREYVFSEHSRDYYIVNTDFASMVRDHRWKLVTFAGHADGMLCDLKSDPDELDNRWDDPDCADVRDRLRATLFDWLRSGDLANRHRN